MDSFTLQPDKSIYYLGYNPRHRFVSNAAYFIGAGYTPEILCQSFVPSVYNFDRVFLVKYNIAAMNYFIMDDES